MKTIKPNLYFLNLSISNKKKKQEIKPLLILFLLFISICPTLFSQDVSYQLSDDSVIIKPDYRNHLNIPEYNPGLMPLNRQTNSTGVWTELNPKVPRVDYFGVFFINTDTGWACGANGALIKTINGGGSWSVIETNTTTPLLKVRSYNGYVVIASGYDGLILRSTDGGETFMQITSGLGNGFDLWGLQIVNDTLGWACGATALIKTTNGGGSWQIVNTPGYTGNLWWIDFLNNNYGFIAADGKVLRTIDGGINWDIIQAGDNQPLYSIDVIDSLHIAAAGYGGTNYSAKNIYSSDGGYTWITGDTLTTEAVNCIQYVNPDTGYLVMTNVSARKTTNRGQEWTTIQGISDNYELQLLNNNTGFSVGTGLQIKKAESNLDVWNRLIINDNFADVFFVTEEKGFAISNVLYRTTDGGNGWEVNGPGGSSVIFVDSLTGFIGNPGSIWKTTNGGDNWYQTSGSNGASRIFFVDQNTGWAIRNNIIYKTTNKGENWFTLFSAPSSITFYNIHFIDSLYGWTANLGGRPYKTTDGGNNWVQQTNLDIWASRDVLFNNYSNGFLLESNKFYKTTTGGISWTLDPGITGFSIAGRFSKYLDSTIFITGYRIFRSLDAGTNWIDYPELTGSRINGLSLLGKGYGFAAGDLGLILNYNDVTVPVELTKFTGTIARNTVQLNWYTSTETNNLGFEIERKGINYNWKKIEFVTGKGTTTQPQLYSFTDKNLSSGKYQYRLKQIDFDGTYEYSDVIEVEIGTPSDYFLSQNYPNPFNPSTKIHYTIPTSPLNPSPYQGEGNRERFVSLKVYDILGKEVANLVNENKEEGFYSVEFDASHLSSGIYIYQIKTPGFTQTRKMILAK